MEEISCPHCGQTHLAGANFCPNTGKSLPETWECPTCGRRVLAGWNVCPSCGNPLGVRSPPLEPPRPTLTSRVRLAVALTALALLIAGGIYVFGFSGLNFPKEQDAKTISTDGVTPASNLSVDSQSLSDTNRPFEETLETPSVSLTLETPVPSIPILTLDAGAESTRVAQTVEVSLTEISLSTSTISVNTAAAQTTSALLTEEVYPTLTPLSISSSPRGKIVFTCQIYRDPNRNQICVIQADGSGWRRLSSDDQADHMYPSFSPDGESIVFSLTKGEDRQIFEMDLYGRQRQLTYLPLRAYAPAISPDNRRIIFTGNDGEQQLLWVMNRDGSNPTCLTPTIGGEAFDPTWSPDSRQILFAATVAGDTQLYVINADGSGLNKITQLSDLRGRSDWSPDGETIATYRGLSWQREVILLAQDGEFLAQITDGGNNLAPNFSPDGQWVAFTSYRDNYRNDNGCDIYTMRLDGSQVERLTDNDYCDWQPNWGP